MSTMSIISGIFIVLIVIGELLLLSRRKRSTRAETYAICLGINQCTGHATDEDCDGHAYCMLECEGCPYWHGDERYDK